MKLINKLMEIICAEMEWVNIPSPELFSGSLRTKLTPRCDAVEAVVEAARAIVKIEEEGGGIITPHGGCIMVYRKFRDALAALEATRDA